MKNAANTATSRAKARDVFQPIRSDLLDSLSSQAECIAAEQDRVARQMAEPPAPPSVLERTTATLRRMQGYHAPLSSFVHKLNRAVR